MKTRAEVASMTTVSELGRILASRRLSVAISMKPTSTTGMLGTLYTVATKHGESTSYFLAAAIEAAISVTDAHDSTTPEGVPADGRPPWPGARRAPGTGRCSGKWGCGHDAAHWIAAGQDVCGHPGGCNCEHYHPEIPAEVRG
jgi:hypothetical protein